jgi:hypothetical protein
VKRLVYGFGVNGMRVVTALKERFKTKEKENV